MKNTWVLSVKTSLPHTCESSKAIVTRVYAFESFDEARAATRRVIRDYAFTKNAMFDGNGNMSYLLDYLNEITLDYLNEEYDWGEGMLTPERLNKAYEALRAVFSGEEALLDLEEGDYSDFFIAFKYENGAICFYGDDDGPCNGYDPVISTNMFSMLEEKDYYLYLDDMMGQDGASSELYVDLKRAEEFRF